MYGVQLDNKDTYSFEPSLCIHLLSDKSNYLSSRYPFPDLYEAPAILLYDRVRKLKKKFKKNVIPNIVIINITINFIKIVFVVTTA